MTKINSSLNSAIEYADLIKSKVYAVSMFGTADDKFNIGIRLMDTVRDLNDNILKGFSKVSKIEKIRIYTQIVGNLLMCEDYLEYLKNVPNSEIEITKNNIKNLSEILLKSIR
jgi:predicted transcriptional regulator